MTDQTTDQTYRLEVRWDFTGSAADAAAEAQRVANTLNQGEVTAIMDENWDDVDPPATPPVATPAAVRGDLLAPAPFRYCDGPIHSENGTWAKATLTVDGHGLCGPCSARYWSAMDEGR